MAALLMHQALVMDVEAGVSPTVAIQAATLNVAKAFKKDRDFGSVEKGKVADMSIIEGDPLQDIWMTQNVKMVIMDGKVVDIGFRNYQNPIPSAYTYQSLPLDIHVAPRFLRAGDGPTVIQVSGEGIWPFHKVMLDGKPLATRFVSKNRLEAVVEPGDIASAGTYFITVKSEGEPLPTSHRAHIVVGFRLQQETSRRDPRLSAAGEPLSLN
jgi:hypothetical protein